MMPGQPPCSDSFGETRRSRRDHVGQNDVRVGGRFTGTADAGTAVVSRRLYVAEVDKPYRIVAMSLYAIDLEASNSRVDSGCGFRRRAGERERTRARTDRVRDDGASLPAGTSDQAEAEDRQHAFHVGVPEDEQSLRTRLRRRRLGRGASPPVTAGNAQPLVQRTLVATRTSVDREAIEQPRAAAPGELLLRAPVRLVGRVP